MRTVTLIETAPMWNDGIVGSESQIEVARNIINAASSAWLESHKLVANGQQERFELLEDAYWAKVEKRCTRENGRIYAEDVIGNADYFPSSAAQLKTNFSFFVAC